MPQLRKYSLHLFRIIRNLALAAGQGFPHGACFDEMDDIRHTLCVINAQIAGNVSVPKHLIIICRHIFPLPQKDRKPLRIVLEPDGLQKQEKKRILLHQIGFHLQNLLLQVFRLSVPES